MRKGLLLATLGAAVLAIAVVLVHAGDEPTAEAEMKMAFGGPEDVAFAEGLWEAMDGYQDWPLASDYTPGNSPHGAFIRNYYSIVSVGEKPYHVVVKENFGGDGATLETVAASPGDYLMAVTVMVQMEHGYDLDNNDWYWVKYGAGGSVDKNDMDMALAGRVAKGATMGCIACHSNAGGGDYLFVND